MGERDQRAGAAGGGRGKQEPDTAAGIREEGRAKEKIVLHSQEKVNPSTTLLDTVVSSSFLGWLRTFACSPLVTGLVSLLTP